jgi:hypothetical protein
MATAICCAVAHPLKPTRKFRESRRLHLVEFRFVFLGSALITSGERFRHAGNAGGFHEKEIAQPGDRQRHDLVFVFTDEAEALPRPMASARVKTLCDGAVTSTTCCRGHRS